MTIQQENDGIKLEGMTTSNLLEVRRKLVWQYQKMLDMGIVGRVGLSGFDVDRLRKILFQIECVNDAIQQSIVRVGETAKGDDVFQEAMEFLQRIRLNEDEIPF